jgi:hypothetical protein
LGGGFGCFFRLAWGGSNGSDDLGKFAPGVVAGGAERLVAVSHELVQAKFLDQFFAPLLHQAGRREDEDTFGHLAKQIFLDDQAGFDGFAQANLITQHAAPAEAAQRRMGGFKLVRKGLKVEVVQADEFVEATDEQHVGGGKLQAVSLRIEELLVGNGRYHCFGSWL